MQSMKSFLSLATASLVVGAAACQPLSVTNPDAPDRARAVSNGDDVKSLLSSSFNSWFLANQGTEPGLALNVMADVMTCAWGNFGMRFNGQEPRIAYNNSTSSGDHVLAENPWNANYEALGKANDGMGAIRRGVNIGSADTTAAYKALGFLVQGETLGNLGMIFDRAFITDETTNPDTVHLQPYTAVSAAAIAKYDSVIATAAGQSWELPASVAPGLTLDAPTVARIANTMAARQMVFTARTKAENDATNWAKVLTYAENGISTGATPFDITLQGDNGNWYDLFKMYGDYEGWVRTDQRIIAEMDSTQPKEFTSQTAPPKADTTKDHRLATDFTYYSSIPYPSSRGLFFFSNWAHERYLYITWDSPTYGTGPMPIVLAAENDLLIAEALIRTGGDKARAATLINKTRVGRGHRAVPADGAMSNQQLLDMIMYERDIELFATGAGQGYYDRRRIDGLQPMTPRHLPVPALELETDGLPVYTFGGANNPDK